MKYAELFSYFLIFYVNFNYQFENSARPQKSYFSYMLNYFLKSIFGILNHTLKSFVNILTTYLLLLFASTTVYSTNCPYLSFLFHFVSSHSNPRDVLLNLLPGVTQAFGYEPEPGGWGQSGRAKHQVRRGAAARGDCVLSSRARVLCWPRLPSNFMYRGEAKARGRG